MTALLFWFHLMSLIALISSLTAEVLIPLEHTGSFRSCGCAIKASLGLWTGIYALFYFFYAFFPETSSQVFTILTLLSLAAGSLFAASVLSCSRMMLIHDRTAGSAWSPTSILAPATVLIVLGLVSMALQDEVYILIYLHLFYTLLVIAPAAAYWKGPADIPARERQTLLLLSVGSLIIFLDHLYLNFIIDPASGVTDGIPSAGLLAFSLALMSFRRFSPAVQKPEAPPVALAQEMIDSFGLTPREAEIGFLISSGLSAKEIAEQLFISIKTVEAHTYNLYQKCAVRRRAAFIALVYQRNRDPRVLQP